jgi:glycine/D-amino acid oxidase-like deaminating enzyme
MLRRDFLGRAAGVGALGALGLPGRLAAQLLANDPLGSLVPLRASPDRLFRITVCLRPFRAAGPRIEAEEIGRKQLIHHYGHGGSGWSLSWGSAEIVTAMAMASSPKEIAVIGAGAIGLTTAISLQRAGAKVTIYAKERFPLVRSARATGTWSPDSRVALADAVAPDFAARWEAMARASFAHHQSYLGLPGDPVEWTDRYMLSDTPPSADGRSNAASHIKGFVDYASRVRDLTPRSEILAPGSHPFATPFARRNTSVVFNVADLAHQLETDFLLGGGRFVPIELHEPSDFARIREKLIVNCTGFGARALMNDESIIPVRGQIAWLIPQAGANYGIYYNNIGVLSRRDGIVVQDGGIDDAIGYNDFNEEPDRANADASIAIVASMFARPKPPIAPAPSIPPKA